MRASALAAFAAALALNLLGASYVSTEGDAWTEAGFASQPEPEFRPHHLLLTELYRGALHVSEALGLHAPSFVPLQVVNGLLGALAAALVALWLARYPLSRRAVWLGAAIWILSYAPWFHARTAETGIPALPAALAAFLLVCPPAGEAARARAGRTALAAALLA